MYSKIKALKEKPETANAGSRWTDDEVNLMLSEIKNGKTHNEIATIHKRTFGSIIGKLLSVAEQLINSDKPISVEDASKKIKLPIADINEHLIKCQNKPPKKKKSLNIKEDVILEEDDEEENIQPQEIILNYEQESALTSFKKGNNIFLTGPAGTGKSVTLKKIIEHCETEGISFGVTATTGSAAFLIGGRTLHSYLGIGLAKESAKELFAYARYKLSHTVKKLRLQNVLIIDEISMLDLELLEKISEYLSLVRYNNKPFGGLQLVLNGDFCQLEPVSGDYCFKSELWKKLNLDTIYLYKMIRQDGDNKFQKMLSKFRYGICSDKHYETLLKYKENDVGSDLIKPTILYPKNFDVDKVNKAEYNKLIKSGAEKKIYEVNYPTIKKNKDKAMTWLKSLDVPESVELCVGAQVVVTANIDQDKGIVNGTRGSIINVKNNKVIIKRIDGSSYDIEYFKTVNIEDKEIYIYYMPLKLAYALTIHKAQGMTLDALEIDIGSNIFASGQAYTAISRAKNLKSIKIKSVSKNSFIIKDSVLEFYKKVEEDIEIKNTKFIEEIIQKLINNLNNNINVENSLNFIWECIDADDKETLEYFDDFKLDEKLISKLEKIKVFIKDNLDLIKKFNL